MIDIHCHILPGLDDGAADVSISLEMARLAVAEGIHTVIATPHHRNGRYDNPAEVVEAAVAQLNHELAEQSIPLTVLSGQEVRVHSDLLDGLESGEICRLHRTPYLLLELPSHSIPDEMENLLYELSVMNIIPIIAHPERNAAIMSEPEQLLTLLDNGAYSQITASSVNGLFGSTVQKTALELCKRGMVHLIASDAHHPKLRPYGLREAYERLRDVQGEQEVDDYMSNAELLVEGGDIPRIEPVRSRKKKKRWYLFGKNTSS